MCLKHEERLWAKEQTRVIRLQESIYFVHIPNTDTHTQAHKPAQTTTNSQCCVENIIYCGHKPGCAIYRSGVTAGQTVTHSQQTKAAGQYLIRGQRQGWHGRHLTHSVVLHRIRPLSTATSLLLNANRGTTRKTKRKKQGIRQRRSRRCIFCTLKKNVMNKVRLFIDCFKQNKTFIVSYQHLPSVRLLSKYGQLLFFLITNKF